MLLRQIPYEEDLSRWIELPPHTNVMACFNTFEHIEGDKVYKFSLSEMSNSADMYKYIQTMNLNLGFNIPLAYMEVIYDCMI
jgi:hypothetical protein